MALTLDITIDDIKEAAGLIGGFTKHFDDAAVDIPKMITEGVEQMEDDLTLAGIKPDDIDEEDKALRYAGIYKALSVIFFGFIRTPGDAWELRHQKAEKIYVNKLRRATITMTDTSQVKVGQGTASR